MQTPAKYGLPELIMGENIMPNLLAIKLNISLRKKQTPIFHEPRLEQTMQSTSTRTKCANGNFGKMQEFYQEISISFVPNLQNKMSRVKL